MIIAQRDEICDRCGSEIPIGAWCEATSDDEIYCQECFERLQVAADMEYERQKEEGIFNN